MENTTIFGENFSGNILAGGLLLGHVDAAVTALAQDFGHEDGVALDLLHRHQ
jgi:hypothetical protein